MLKNILRTLFGPQPMALMAPYIAGTAGPVVTPRQKYKKCP